MASASFTIVTGKRCDGNLYLSNGFVYKRAVKKRNGDQYLKCADDVGICPGSAVVRNGQSTLTKLKDHYHGPNETENELVRYRHSLRALAGDLSVNSHGFRNICDSESLRYPLGSLCRGFAADEQLMRRARNRKVPPIPKDLDDLHDILNFHPEWRDFALSHGTHEEFFRETIHAEDGSKVAVMVSPYFEDLLCVDGAQLSADGTFDARPSHPATEQLLSVHVTTTINDVIYNYPCAYVLMERKSEAAYIAAFRAINSAVEGKMKPGTAIADFEKALHNALRAVFPDINTSGCWFHYCQAVQGKTHDLHLEPLCLRNDVAAKAVQKCLALPLLPPGAIEEGLALIEEELAQANLSRQFASFIGYIRTQWLDDFKVGVDMLSVFELISRTNNIVECSHWQLYRKLQVSRPNFWVFYDSLKTFDFARHQDRQRVSRNVQVRRARPHKYILQDRNIQDMQRNLSEGSLNVEDFLRRACHAAEGLQKRLQKRNNPQGDDDEYYMI